MHIIEPDPDAFLQQSHGEQLLAKLEKLKCN